MWCILFLPGFLYSLSSAAPLGNTQKDIIVVAKEKSDVVEKNIHSHENERNPSIQNGRRDKMFTHNLFDLANIDISGAVAGDEISIGSHVEIKDHVDSPEDEYGELLNSLFKQIDSNDDGLINKKELLKICQENKIYITEMDAERILTGRNKLLGLDMAEFGSLVDFSQGSNTPDLIYSLLQAAGSMEDGEFGRHLQFVFLVLDADHDCKLSVQDIIAVFGDIGKDNPMADNYEDGSGVDFEEWKSIILKEIFKAKDNSWRKIFNFYETSGYLDGHQEASMDAGVKVVAKSAMYTLALENKDGDCYEAELVKVERVALVKAAEGLEYKLKLWLATMEGQGCEDEMVKICDNVKVLKPLPGNCRGIASLKLINQDQITCRSSDICRVGKSNSGDCFCKASTDDSGYLCTTNQVCTKEGDCINDDTKDGDVFIPHCSVGQSSLGDCICKRTHDESLEQCTANQVCTEDGLCRSVCATGSTNLGDCIPVCAEGETNCFCQSATNESGEVCGDKQPCKDDGACFTGTAMFNNANCTFDDDKYLREGVVQPQQGTQRSPHSQLLWFKWEGGKIPYYFKGYTTDGDKQLFRSIMDEIESHTCYKYELQDSEPSGHHLEIVIDEGAKSCINGFSAYVQPLTTSKVLLRSYLQLTDYEYCDWGGGVIHEMMHALGVGHTQKRSDRDEHITIKATNVKSEALAQYDKCVDCKLYEEVPYDCNSIMHYGQGTFSNGLGPTMEAKDPSCELSWGGPAFSGSREPSPSDWDLLRIISLQVCDEERCNGINDGCCTVENPCGENDGDCDNNDQCKDDLVCGFRNCEWGGTEDDCCYNTTICCDHVHLETSHEDWRSTPFYASNLEGGFNPTGHTVNGLFEYRSENNANYCLWMNDIGQWMINECSVGGISGYVLGYGPEGMKCPNEATSWIFYSQTGQGWVADNDMKVHCEAHRSWSGPQEKDWGDECGNMGMTKEESLEKCQQACLDEPTCTAIRYHPFLRFCIKRKCPLPVPLPQMEPTIDGFQGYFVTSDIPTPKCKCGINPTGSEIVGGSVSKVNEFPWMVRFEHDEKLLCGGSVISSQWIATAAHCFYRGFVKYPVLSSGSVDLAAITITLGEHDIQSETETDFTTYIKAEDIIIHEKFSPYTYTYDIALVKLSSEINVNIFTPVCLPPPGEKYTGETVTVSGWGALSEWGQLADKLQKLDITVVDDATAKNKFSWLSDEQLDVMVFVGGEEGKDACVGDSGGPLIFKRNGHYELIGITSWGWGCAREGYPGAYAEVSAFKNWIGEKIEDTNTCYYVEQTLMRGVSPNTDKVVET